MLTISSFPTRRTCSLRRFRSIGRGWYPSTSSLISGASLISGVAAEISRWWWADLLDSFIMAADFSQISMSWIAIWRDRFLYAPTLYDYPLRKSKRGCNTIQQTTGTLFSRDWHTSYNWWNDITFLRNRTVKMKTGNAELKALRKYLLKRCTHFVLLVNIIVHAAGSISYDHLYFTFIKSTYWQHRLMPGSSGQVFAVLVGWISKKRRLNTPSFPSSSPKSECLGINIPYSDSLTCPSIQTFLRFFLEIGPFIIVSNLARFGWVEGSSRGTASIANPGFVNSWENRSSLNRDFAITAVFVLLWKFDKWKIGGKGTHVPLQRSLPIGQQGLDWHSGACVWSVYASFSNSQSFLASSVFYIPLWRRVVLPPTEQQHELRKDFCIPLNTTQTFLP